MADYDDLMEIMKNMRAMRRLHPDPVPDELIRKILQAGSCAPNGGNTQRWRFLVIKDTKIKQAVQVWYKKAFDEVVGPRYLKSAPPPGVTRAPPAACSGLRDISTRHLLYEKEAEAALGLPPGVRSYAILPIGYPMGKFGPVGRGPLAEIVYQDRWGNPYKGV